MGATNTIVCPQAPARHVIATARLFTVTARKLFRNRLHNQPVRHDSPFRFLGSIFRINNIVKVKLYETDVLVLNPS